LKLTIVSIVISTQICFGQIVEYFSSNMEWEEYYVDCAGNSSECLVREYTISSRDQLLRNGKVFYDLFQEGTELWVNPFNDSILIPEQNFEFNLGYFSGESKQITKLDLASNTEEIIYDFRYDVSDSLLCNSNDELIGIDSIFIGNSKRNVYKFEESPDLIEGIGFISGFRDFCGSGNSLQHGCMTMLSYSANGDKLIVDTIVNNICDPLVTTSTSSLRNTKSLIDVYPNPSNSFLFIRSNCFARIESAEIISIDGKVISEIEFFNSRIGITSLKSGLYFVRVLFANREVETVKFSKL